MDIGHWLGTAEHHFHWTDCLTENMEKISHSILNVANKVTLVHCTQHNIINSMKHYVHVQSTLSATQQHIRSVESSTVSEIYHYHSKVSAQTAESENKK